MKKWIFLFTILFSAPSFADEFTPSYWSEGIHLLAGGGLNSSVYISKHERDDAGLGLNLKTDLLYVFHPQWAVEWSANVKFNRVRSYLVWDTLFTLGLRAQIPDLETPEWGTPYARLFIGRAPTVIFLNGDTPSNVSDPSVSRIHLDGPVAGIGWGLLNKTQKGQVWFSEISFTIQSLEQEDDVRMDGDVPVVVSSSSRTDNSNIYSLSWTVGILAF
ncbi:hypothetical protein AZI87_01140 [Bdellovibrio bacteriovorus]|uniref:Outer membrane protein beta-barrel domain-containing protein n=1 Tax=Bdellovibrio bacteriovorus TaxID=959 RepID=A0A162GDU5_BDEBC|nr:hypothetical protein [Bdellovibrio bacteriovorus]KYG67911.1 hypothetical protein AZI87_01140 [Bdellovibrio bacteriovorus]